MGCLGRDPYDYCANYLTADRYRSTYTERIHPIPILERPKKKDASQAAVTVTPPPTHRPPGRTTTKKVGSHEVARNSNVEMKGIGHNKSTCKEVTGKLRSRGQCTKVVQLWEEDSFS